MALAARGGESEADEAGRWLGILGPWPLCPLQETIDVGGFSALVVGLALLPFAGACEFIAISFWLQRSGIIQSALLPGTTHILGYALSAAVSVISGASFELGPFGLQLTSIFVTVGLPGFAHVKRFGF